MARMLALAAALVALAGCGPFAREAELPPEEVAGAALVAVDAGSGPVRLAVTEQGRGPPLVLLHGLGVSSFTWRLITPELARSHRVIAIDLKGFGASDKPPGEEYALTDQAALVAAFLKQQRLENVTLVGHSFGGGVALAAALAELPLARKRIARLVLIDSIAYAQPTPFFFRILQTPVVGELGQKMVPAEMQARQAMRIAFVDPARIDPAAITAYAEPLRSEAGRHALRATVAKIAALDADAFARGYAGLQLPALVLWCDADRIVPVDFGRRLAKELPRAELAIVSGCGHMPHEEQPEQTLMHLLSFLRATKDEAS